MSIRKSLSKNAVDIAQAIVSLEVVGDVLTDNLTTLTKVGLGNILKVTIGSTAYVVFADDASATVTADASASPALELPSGTHYILCSGEFIKMSVDPTRKELIRI